MACSPVPSATKFRTEVLTLPSPVAPAFCWVIATISRSMSRAGLLVILAVATKAVMPLPNARADHPAAVATREVRRAEAIARRNCAPPTPA